MAKSRSYGSLVTTLVILAAAAGGGYYYWKNHQEKGPDFYTAQVTRGEVIQTVTATGTIKPFQDVLVSSQISGYITSLGVDFNSKVKKGDLLATLLPTAYEAAVQSAKGDLANSRANAQLQAVNLKRDKDLLQKNLISQSDYDTQEALTEEADAQVQIKSATLLTAKTNLDYCRITSPIDGMVISRAVDVGNSVAATLNSPTLFEIANDLTKMQIDAAVSEADIGNVANGQAVNFTVDAYPNRTFTGTVYQIRSAPSTQQSVVIYDVMISVENPELKLRPGMTANAAIVIARHANVIKVPNSALRFRMPESLAMIPPPPAPVASPVAAAAPSAKPAKPAKPLTPTQNRAGVRQILQEVSYVPGTPPTPEMLVKMKELAAKRGIELPDRLLSGAGHNNFSGSAEAPVTRTVYVLPNDLPGAKATVVRVRLGITDGTDTEVLGGLTQGQIVVVGLNDIMPSPGAHSPFGGGRHF